MTEKTTENTKPKPDPLDEKIQVIATENQQLQRDVLAMENDIKISRDRIQRNLGMLAAFTEAKQIAADEKGKAK
tara:strand:+ start:2047 stop:2268 length:222 start_codon:yes stop_codon:yes gene_type:complete